MNYRHLYYFWIAAKEGSITRAAERLGLAVQTVSTQIGLLEQELGKALFKPAGRRLVLTEAGHVALGYADQIFLLGEQMRDALDQADTGRTRLIVGISDSLPKLTAFHLLQAAGASVRLVCYEAQFEALLAELALHKLDLVLADRAVRSTPSMRVFSHQVGDSAMMVAGMPALAERYRANFPRSLDKAPFLLPTRNTALRGPIEQWFEQYNIHPDVVGEFEDNALLTTFARSAAGLFFAPAVLADALREQLGALQVGPVPEVREQFYAISKERKLPHPAIAALLSAKLAD